MHPGTFVLGLDFGTASGRAMLVRASDGEEIAWHVAEYPSGVIDSRLPSGRALGPEWALQDPRDYLFVLRECIPRVLAKSGVAASQIAGIGVDFTACTILPTLRDGTPLCVLPEFADRPHAWVKLWKHHAAQPEATLINEVGARREEPAMRAYSGRYSSEWFFSKTLEMLRDDPEIYGHAEGILEAGDWIVWQLTGHERRSECAAGYKGMWIKGVGFPSPEFFAALDSRLRNVTEKLASEYYPLGASAGGITAEIAEMTGLREGTPVAVANVDAHAAVPACGVVEPGALVMIMGTSLCHMLLGAERKYIEGVAGVVEDGIVPGYWGYEAGQAAVGDLYAWFFRTFGADPDDMTAKAAQLRPGQSGLLALDWWNGNRSVLMNADLTGVLIGATLATRPEEIYRALVEATAFGAYTVIRAFERQGVPIQRLIGCGGIAGNSPLAMQIFADVTNRTIHLPATLQASCLGAAMHGAVAGGVYRDIGEAAARMARLQSRQYEPDPSAHATYELLYAEYESLHDYFGRGATGAMARLKALKAACGDR
jgi:L-ribulokinase